MRSVVAELARVWRQPAAFMADRLAEEAREDRAFAVLMAACGLSFVAQWPGLARAAHIDPAVPLEARMAGALMATIFLLPILAYGLAALGRLVARALGGQGGWYGARLALFWAWLAAAPLALLSGVATAMLGPGLPAALAGAAVFAAFLWLWVRLLAASERAGPAKGGDVRQWT